MKIFNKNLLLEVKKSGEEGPFNEAEAELLVGKGYTCRLDAGDDVYYCTPPKSEKKDDKKTEKKDDKKTEKKDGTGTSQDDSGGNQGQSQGGGQDRSRANEIPSHIECEAWENENKFTKKFPGQENEKAKDFKDWLYNYVSPGSTMAKYYNFAYSYQSKYDGFCSPSTKEYETDEILHKSPFIRELATFESRGKILFDWWIETSGGNFSKKSSPTNVDSGQKTQNNNQVKNDETKNQQMNSTQIKSKDFDSAQEMFNEIKSSDIYTLDANLSSQVNKYENLFKLSNSTNIEDRRAGKSCSTLVSTYVSAAQSRVDRSFGNPETKKTNPGVYKQVSTYWYEFLESLVSIKNKIYSCGVKRYIDSDQSELLTTTQRVVGSPWPVALSNPDHDDNTLQDFFNELTESVIKRKLEQKLEEKLIKESIRKKLLLKSDLKESKVGKISENLYKIAGEFYTGDKQTFVKKLVRLTESYKKSKMHLTEGSSDSFSIAFDRVFKGDEEEIKVESISYFLDKLGLEGAIRASVKEELEKIPSDEITKMFTDDWSDIVVKAIVKNAESDDSAPENVMGAIQKVVASQIEMSSETQKRLEKEISKLLTPVRDSKIDKIKSIADEIKRKIIDLKP